MLLHHLRCRLVWLILLLFFGTSTLLDIIVSLSGLSLLLSVSILEILIVFLDCLLDISNLRAVIRALDWHLVNFSGKGIEQVCHLSHNLSYVSFRFKVSNGLRKYFLHICNKLESTLIISFLQISLHQAQIEIIVHDLRIRFLLLWIRRLVQKFRSINLSHFLQDSQTFWLHFFPS